ncbi:MAG: hypothetical protein PHV42_03505 [Candidatus Pacebacteria bacterium]|nr:hypothetical protein [Candidatus Paceibacterota bacterium]
MGWKKWTEDEKKALLLAVTKDFEEMTAEEIEFLLRQDFWWQLRDYMLFCAAEIGRRIEAAEKAAQIPSGDASL